MCVRVCMVCDTPLHTNGQKGNACVCSRIFIHQRTHMHELAYVFVCDCWRAYECTTNMHSSGKGRCITKKTHTCTENLSGTSSTSVLFVSSSEITHTHTAINAHASNICTLRKYSVLLLLLICIYALDICCSRTSEADE